MTNIALYSGIILKYHRIIKSTGGKSLKFGVWCAFNRFHDAFLSLIRKNSWLLVEGSCAMHWNSISLFYIFFWEREIYCIWIFRLHPTLICPTLMSCVIVWLPTNSQLYYGYNIILCIPIWGFVSVRPATIYCVCRYLKFWNSDW